MEVPRPPGARTPLRWRTAAEEQDGALFPDERVAAHHVGVGEYRGLEFLDVNARTIINPVPAASRMPFRYTINAYRGCSHACTYCFARPTHEYLGLDVGRDFERRIVVKVNAVERLRAELRAPTWSGDHIAMGTNTDPYQHAEGKYHLTRGIVEVLAEAGNPFSILTKSTLVLRDLEVLAEAARRTSLHLSFSIGTLDREVWRATEPGTPPPDKRVAAVRRLSDAGIPCGVLVAPILPGLSDGDEQVREVARACLEAGAVSVTPIALHLRPGVRPHFMDWLEATHPDLVPVYRTRFGHRSYQPKVDQARLAALVGEVEAERRASGRRSPDPSPHPRGIEPPDPKGRSERPGGTGQPATATGRPWSPAPASRRTAPSEQLRLL